MIFVKGGTFQMIDKYSNLWYATKPVYIVTLSV